MNSKEAFKIGFLHKCAEDGLTPDETLERVRHATLLVKSAGWGMPTMAALTLLGATPFLVGTTGGYALQQMRENTGLDAKDMKKREVIAEYRRAVDRMRRLQQRVAPDAVS